MTRATPPGDRRDRQEQIAADLRARILAGDIAAGEAIPTTKQLQERYQVTDRTARRAVAVLVEEGLVQGRAGSRVYATAELPSVVRADHYPTPAGSTDRYPWISEAVRRGRDAHIELVDVSERPAPAQVAAAFGIDRGAPVVVRHQLLRLDGQPAELVWLHYPLDIARGTPLAEPRQIPGGTPRLLAELGHPVGRAVDQVSARVADVAECTRLQLPRFMPVLRQFRVVYCTTGSPVEASVQVKAGHMYELQYHLPAPPER